MPDVNCRKGVPEAAALKQLKGARSRRGGAHGHEVVLGHEGVHEHEVGHWTNTKSFTPAGRSARAHSW